MVNLEPEDNSRRRTTEILVGLTYYGIGVLLLCIALFGLLSIFWDSSALLAQSRQMHHLF